MEDRDRLLLEEIRDTLQGLLRLQSDQRKAPAKFNLADRRFLALMTIGGMVSGAYFIALFITRIT